MKKKLFIGLVGLFLLQSCILKSLRPFYTQDKLIDLSEFQGTWSDSKNGSWELLSVEKDITNHNDGKKLSKDDQEALKKYGKGLLIKYTEDKKEVTFIAMGFQVNNAIFIDFTPVHLESNDMNELGKQHLVETHSVAKLERKNKNEVSLIWLEEKDLKPLLEEQKLKLDHMKNNISLSGNDLLLTASPKELYQFLVAFNKSHAKEIQESDDAYHLKRKDV
ncbi:MAG: hypothetical protein OIF50_05160 [Flavobacteriaceae bacterium]|nr:hypothetical protein [Flavobacteriaceae bacterium]